jgi:hypothetical protein
METQINRLRKRQRRSSRRQIEVVGGGVAPIQRLRDGKGLEGEDEPGREQQTPTTGIQTQQPENTRTPVNYSS